jgi:hypothetical protein
MNRRPERLGGQAGGQQRAPRGAETRQVSRSRPQAARRGQDADPRGCRLEAAGIVELVAGHRVPVWPAAGEKGVGHAERPEHQGLGRVLVPCPGGVSDELPEDRVAANAVASGAARS